MGTKKGKIREKVSRAGCGRKKRKKIMKKAIKKE